MAAGEALAKAAAKASGETGLAVAAAPDGQMDAGWKRVQGLGCDLTVDLPLPHFRIADLLKLRQGSVIDAHWKVGHDAPLCLNGTLIGWVEFEVVAANLAVRLTELA
jgi:flagellar motor switch/type III secretory pathway protein FliN